MTAPAATAPGSPADRPKRRTIELDLGFGTVVALTWLVATVAAALTLWVVVGVIGG